ncbi:hypothetical protein Ahy_A07g035691 [Arachis hypogaea]|uniref:BED-type domain-containing protein n=1 Tax=Arachis hypogaea TaxID=3818 RepID=A0A445CEJ3_ARAHY|nr:hypothetical protein Ahy_A07g035691 [Arachis hypogaea]
MDNSVSMKVDGGNVTQNPENMERFETEEDIKKKKTKTTTSDVWRNFTKLGPSDDGIDHAQCDGCKQKFKAGGKQYGISSLKRHLDSCCLCFTSRQRSKSAHRSLVCHHIFRSFFVFPCTMFLDLYFVTMF